MQGLKIIDPRLGFPAGVCQVIQITPKNNRFIIEVTDLREGTKTCWTTADGESVMFATWEEAERCLARFQDIVTSLDLSPYPPVAF